jgi:toxin ParE1/3/4
MPRRRSERLLAVLITPAAGADLDEAFAYITPRNASASRDLLERLKSATDRLREFPLLGAAVPSERFEMLDAGIRFVVVEPYLVFYRVRDREIVVLRVLHARRDALGELFE